MWFVRDAGSIVRNDGTEVALGPRLFLASRTAEELATTAAAAGVSADTIKYGLRPLWNGLEEVLFEALRAGASPDEAAAGVTSAILSDAQRLANVIAMGGFTTFDLPSEFESGGNNLSMRLRLAQVVFTMTQVGSNERIRFSIDGQPVNVLSKDGTVLDRPVTREDFEDLLPPMIVEVPRIGSEVASPVRIAGTAQAAEGGKVTARVLDAAGNVLSEDFVTVTCGTGCHGDYEIELRFDVSSEQPGLIQVEPERDNKIPLVEIPVTLIP